MMELLESENERLKCEYRMIFAIARHRYDRKTDTAQNPSKEYCLGSLSEELLLTIAHYSE